MAFFLRRTFIITLLAPCSWACGGDVGSTNANGAGGVTSGGSTSVVEPPVGGVATIGGSGSLTLPFDPTAGCRDLSNTGCNRCCTPYVDPNGAEQCGVKDVSQGSPTYSSVAGPCGSDCPVCARCTNQYQQVLEDAANNPRPECYCPTTDTGVDPCMDRSGCACFCSTLIGSLISCPQLGQSACINGNQCRAIIVASPGPYAPGDQLEALWINFGTEATYLGNCGNLAIGRSDIGTSTTLLQAAPCSAGASGKLASGGGSLPWTVKIPNDIGAGVLWLHGTFYIGCDGNIPESSHCTAGPLDVYYIVDVKAQ